MKFMTDIIHIIISIAFKTIVFKYRFLNDTRTNYIFWYSNPLGKMYF